MNGFQTAQRALINFLKTYFHALKNSVFPKLRMHYALSIVLSCTIGLSFCSFRNQGLTCVGNHYHRSLAMNGKSNPNRLTMQQLCSKPQYGGHPQHSLNEWCLYPERPSSRRSRARNGLIVYLLKKVAQAL